ncbi:hypothetical protein Tco_0385511 [Tanacetum coccineum]
MSSPNRSTSDLEDALSSMNILNYTSVSSDYFPASSGSSSFNSSENSTDNMIPPVFSSFYNIPCLKDVQAFYAKELPISSPDPITPPAILTPSSVLPTSLLFDPRYFFVPEELLPPKKRIHKMYLKHHEKQVEDILNYLDELHLHRIERMEEGRINSNKLKTELKGIRTQIIRLQKERSRKAQTAVIVSASNPNNLTGTPAVKTRNYKEFISLSPSDLNGTEGSVGLFAVERLNQYLTKQMCEENKVKLLLVLYCDALSLVECPCQPYRNRAS